MAPPASGIRNHPVTFLEALEAALQEEYGISVSVPEGVPEEYRDTLRAKLYEARRIAKAAGDSRFDDLTFRPSSSNPRALFILHKKFYQGIPDAEE